MSDPLVRAAVVVAVLVVVVIGARVSTRIRGAPHAPVSLAGLALPPGVVVFTSTECANCKSALAVARSGTAPVREVTWELEPGLQEAAGVESVPLTVVTDGDGRVVAQFTGVPRARRLARAVQRAGW